MVLYNSSSESTDEDLQLIQEKYVFQVFHSVPFLYFYYYTTVDLLSIITNFVIKRSVLWSSYTLCSCVNNLKTTNQLLEPKSLKEYIFINNEVQTNLQI